MRLPHHAAKRRAAPLVSSDEYQLIPCSRFERTTTLPVRSAGSPCTAISVPTELVIVKSSPTINCRQRLPALAG